MHKDTKTKTDIKTPSYNEFIKAATWNISKTITEPFLCTACTLLMLMYLTGVMEVQKCVAM